MTLYSNNWMLASFSLTVLSAPYWPWMPEWGFAFICLAALMTATRSDRFRGLSGVALAMLVIITHGSLVRSQSNTIFQVGRDITIKGEVDSFFKQISYGYEGSAVVRSINGQKLTFFHQPRIRLIAPTALQPGDQFTFPVTVKPIYGRLNDVGFDAEAYALSRGWVAQASVKAQASFEILSTRSWRSWLYDKLKRSTRGRDSQGMILALTFGDRQGMTARQWRSLRDSGLIHLVAISGLHIGMAFAIGYGLGGVLMRLNVRLLSLPFVCGIVLATLYAWLAGFTLPTQRALIMCVLNAALILGGVHLGAMQRVLVTLTVVLAMAPFASLSTSFWLSFLAVVVVFFLLADFTGRYRGWRQIWRMQWALVAMMVPVSAYFFAGVSLLAAVYNLIFIPWFSVVIVPLLFLALFLTLWMDDLAWLWSLVDGSFLPLTLSLSYAQWSWMSVSHSTSLMLAAAVMVWMVRSLLSRLSLVVIVMLVLGYIALQQRTNDWRMDVLDVGHGLAVLIERNQRALLYDTGSGWSGGSYVRSLVVPMLNRRGITRLDGVILSHTDSDHAGGIEDAKTLLSPRWMMASQRIPGWRTCTAGQTWRWQGLTFDTLWPPKTVTRAANLHSCVIRLSDPNSGHSILLAGDVTAVGEWLLSRQAKVIQSDVIIVPHHGSKTSSTRHFIERVAPQWAIASLAKGNQWHLPHESVVERYRDAGVRWLDTGESGQITLSYRAGAWYVSTQRMTGYSPWYRQMLRKEVE